MIRKRTVTALVLPVCVAATALVGCADTSTPGGQPASSAAAAEPRRIDAVVVPYLDLRRLLAEDKLDGVSARMADLQKAAQSLSDHPDETVRTQARAVAERAAARTGTLKEARAAYKGVSEAMVELVKAAPPSNKVADTLYVAYCGMAKAPWLQTTKQLSNPYMGQEMPECGEVKETIETRPA